VAKLNTRKNPHMSVIVVSMGLDTRAGSNLTDFRNNGREPPNTTARIVLAINAPPTTIPK
jgi:hypothetical protein